MNMILFPLTYYAVPGNENETINVVCFDIFSGIIQNFTISRKRYYMYVI